MFDTYVASPEEQERLRAQPDVPDAIGLLGNALGAAFEVDFASLSSDELRETVQALCVAQSRLEATRLAAVAALDANGAWVGDGSLTAAAWISRHTALDGPAARRDVRIAKRLRDTPGARDALAKGTLAPGAAAVIADGAAVDPEAFSQIEDAIVAAASSSPRAKIQAALQHWAELVRGDDQLGRDLQRQHERRGLYLAQTLDGTVMLSGTFDPIQGAELMGIIAAYDQHLFHHDNEHRDSDTDPRTPAQRRADALMDLLRAGAGSAARGDTAPRVPGCATSTTIVLRGEDFLEDVVATDSGAAATSAEASDTAPGETEDNAANPAPDATTGGSVSGQPSARPGTEPSAAHADTATADTPVSNATASTPATPVTPTTGISPDTATDGLNAATASSRATPTAGTAPDTAAGAGDTSTGGRSADVAEQAPTEPASPPLTPNVPRGSGLYLPPRATPPSRTPVPATIGGRDQVLTRGLAEFLTCDTVLNSVIVGPHDQPLAMGRTKRTATRAQRGALNVRDKGCIFSCCDRPPHWCDAHHIDHWEHGGTTDVCNLCLLCRAHHRLMHSPGWAVRIGHDGLPTISYLGIDQPRNSHPPPLHAA